MQEIPDLIGQGTSKDCPETLKLDRVWIEFSAGESLARRAENDEGLEVLGWPEGINSQARH
jgi:hypothetical protein